MAHLYEGEPDGRQADDPGVRPSRFRPRYRPLSEGEAALHDAIKAKAAELEQLFELIPSGEYKGDAMKSLEASVMWAIKQLTA